MTRRAAPRTQSLAIVTQALRTHIPSTPPVCELRRSEKGVPNLRYRAETNGIPWLVDIYLGRLYRVRIGTNPGELQHSIPALLGYLTRNLGIQRASPEN